MARGRELRSRHDLGDLAPQDRNVERARVVRRRRVEAEEPVLADHVAGGVVALHADVVEIRRAVHGRARVRLREHEQRPLAPWRGSPRATGRSGRTPRRPCRCPRRAGCAGCRARCREPRAGCRRRRRRAFEVVLAVAEEREVLVGEPAQAARCPRSARRDHTAVARVEVVTDRVERGEHLEPVARGRADVVQARSTSARTASRISADVSRSTSMWTHDSRTILPPSVRTPSASRSTSSTG